MTVMSNEDKVTTSISDLNICVYFCFALNPTLIILNTRLLYCRQWLVPFIHLLNTTTKVPFVILFLMSIGAIDLPFALGIQCSH